MKKVYIQPSMEAYNVKSETVLAGSDFSVRSGSNDYTSDDFGAKRGHTSLGGFDDDEEDY